MSDGTVVQLGDLVLTGVDELGVRWRTFDPILGWDGSPASSLSLTQKTRAPGGWIGPRQAVGRAVTLPGSIEAPDSATLEDACDRLAAAAAIDGTVLTVTRGGEPRTATVYREGAVDPQWQNDVNALFSLDLIAPDPRKYGPDITPAPTGFPSKSGGLSWPVAWPVTWSGVLDSGVVSIDNPGKYASGVIIRVDAGSTPLPGPIVRHGGRTIALSGNYALPAGSWLTIDTGARQILEADQVDRNTFLISRGWFLADPETTNDFAFDAATRNADAQMTVTVRPAYL